MKTAKAKLCPFNNMLIVLFEYNMKKVKQAKEETNSLKNTAEQYLFYLESRNIKITNVTPEEMKQYFEYLKTDLQLSMHEQLMIKAELVLFFTFLTLPHSIEIPFPKFPRIN